MLGHFFSISELHRKYLAGELSPTEVVNEHLKVIRENQPILNTFISVFDEYALQRARELEGDLQKYRKEGVLPRLFGVPVGIKDNINVKGFGTTCASRILSGYISLYNATVVDRLLRDSAIIMGKLNMDEFAMGALGTYSFYGPTKNPVNPEHLAGGSSSGSAASVSAGEVVVSLGSDTGGSIRLPASFCGVFGLKPTYGTVSRYGLVAFASSLDQIGPIARNVDDLARAYVSISGFDPKDSTSLKVEVPSLDSLLREISPSEIVLGYPDLVKKARMDEEVRDNFFKLVEVLSKAGFKVVEVPLPHLKYSVEVYQIIATSEASSNLARFDGIRYGYRKKAEDLEDLYNSTRSSGFGAEVKRRIAIGTFALSHGYYDAYYLKALKVRRLIKNDLDEAFKKVNLIILPVSPFPAPKVDEIKDPVELYYLDLFSIHANLAGIPSMAIPWGRTKNNLPLGFQVEGQVLSEPLLFNFAYYFEKNFI